MAATAAWATAEDTAAMSSRAAVGRRNGQERLVRLRADRDLLAHDHPYLEYHLDEPQLTGIARGAVPVLLPDGQVDPIEIAIDFHHGYLPGPPTASDAGRRWLPDDDRHIPQDHSFCLYLRDIDEPDLTQPEALRLFMLDVVTFLEQQLIYDRIGRFPGPAWPHKRDAYALYIVERLDREPADAVEPLWEAMRGEQLSRNAPCPCAGGAKYKKCHLGLVTDWAELRPATN
jgi:hypothetical protein